MKKIKTTLLGITAFLCVLGAGFTATACANPFYQGGSANSSSEAESTSENENSSEEDSNSASEENGSSSIENSESEDDSSSSEAESSSSASGDENSGDNSGDEGDEENVGYVYRVSVQTLDGYGLRGVTVRLMNGEDVIASTKTNKKGNADFSKDDVATLGEYKIVLLNAPEGYTAAEANKEQKTSAKAGTTTVIALRATGVISEKASLSLTYSLGSVVHDFSVTDTTGTKRTLSEILQEKELVMLNFWYASCGPCRQEFPALNSAYRAYEDKVEVLAISAYDGNSAVANYKSTYGLDMPMISYENVANADGTAYDLGSAFGVSAYPTTVFIDRNGVVSFMHTGSMTDMIDFTSRFELFLGDDYQAKIIEGTGESDIGDEGATQVKPNVEAPSADDVKKVLSPGSDTFSYRFAPKEGEKDEYAWPWVVSADGKSLETPIKNLHGSYATMYVDFYAEPGDSVTFDYYASTETGYDVLYVIIDGVVVQQLSGTNPNWLTCHAYVFENVLDDATEHEMIFIYRKDSQGSEGDDIVKIKNLRLEHTDEVDALVFRYAATGLNTDENATTQFKHYITPVLNEEDGYYHVNTVDGPILFANMTLSSPFSSNMSVWLFAYYDLVIEDGYNYHKAIEDFAWEAQNNMVDEGYTPVTEELRTLLEIVAASSTVRNSGYKTWQGENHANEWLEMCVYYQHYGNHAPKEDPMVSITYHAAKEVYEGENTANILYAINPRGFKHKFIPTRTGVYKVYSVGDTDTVAFFGGELGDEREFDDLVWKTREVTQEDGTVVEEIDPNFEFYAYMEAGKTYYMLLTTYMDEAATYTFYINYMGETYTYMANAATGPYSFNTVTSELYIPNAIDYVYADPEKTYTYNNPDGDTDGDGENDVPTTGEHEGDGYYHALNADGTLGSIIYLDVIHPTEYFNEDTLKNVCEAALRKDPDTGEYYYPEDKRAFFIGDTDYTPTLQRFVNIATLSNQNDKVGYIAVDAEVFSWLYAVTRSEKYDGVEDTSGNINSWLLLCYYMKELSATNVL